MTESKPIPRKPIPRPKPLSLHDHFDDLTQTVREAGLPPAAGLPPENVEGEKPSTSPPPSPTSGTPTSTSPPTATSEAAESATAPESPPAAPATPTTASPLQELIHRAAVNTLLDLEKSLSPETLSRLRSVQDRVEAAMAYMCRRISTRQDYVEILFRRFCGTGLFLYWPDIPANFQEFVRYTSKHLCFLFDPREESLSASERAELYGWLLIFAEVSMCLFMMPRPYIPDRQLNIIVISFFLREFNLRHILENSPSVEEVSLVR